MNRQSLSSQMQALLRVLDCQGGMSVQQLHTELYDPTAHQNRRAFAASLSRTIRRLEERRLVFRQGETVVITQSGRWAVHPEQYQLWLSQVGQSAREAVAGALAESPEFQKALLRAVEVNASWEQLRRSKG